MLRALSLKIRATFPSRLHVADIYQHYKPFRNILRKQHLEASLIDVWQLARYLSNNDAPSPGRFGYNANSLRTLLYPWDLLLITRELILHASNRGKNRLDTMASLGPLVNAMRDASDAATRLKLDEEDVLIGIHRLAHQQFRFQGNHDLSAMGRYLLVFGQAEFDRIMLAATGLATAQYYFLGMAVAGHLLRSPGVNAAQNYGELGISREASRDFFQRLALPVPELHERFRAEARYDGLWQYTWNELEAHPLVGLDPKNTEHLYCPLPGLWLRRVTAGLYYDLANTKGFSEAFGAAFQNYVGTLLKKFFPSPDFVITAETPYLVGKNTHHGADWILSDSTANLFIECKTKRMRQEAKIALDEDSIEKELGSIADAVVQLYKNISEAEQNLTHWRNNHLPIYPLVVSIEDWFLFSPLLQQQLRDIVKAKLGPAGLCEALLTSKPFTFVSARELENGGEIIRSVGIDAFFRAKTSDEYRDYLLLEFARQAFPGTTGGSFKEVFMTELRKILPVDDVAND